MPFIASFGKQPMPNRIIKSENQPPGLPVRPHAFPTLPQASNLEPETMPGTSQAFTPDVFPCAGEETCPDRHTRDQDQPGPATVSAKPYNGNADVERLADNLYRAVMSMESISRKRVTDVEYAIGLLALHLARLMVRHTAGTQPEIVLAKFAAALENARELTILNIRLNPDDAGLVTGYLKKGPGAVRSGQNLPLNEDPAIERGGFLIETASGVVDATHENQFSMLLRQFQDAGRPQTIQG